MGRRNEPGDDALRATLRTAGLRATSARLAVLRSLYEVSGPVSHGDVAATLSRDGWDRATVYRNLMDLTDAGLVKRTDMGDHVWRFELSGEGHAQDAAHPHFMCDACGDVVCLPDGSVKIVPQKGTPRALVQQRYEVQLKGRCDRCA